MAKPRHAHAGAAPRKRPRPQQQQQEQQEEQQQQRAAAAPSDSEPEAAPAGSKRRRGAALQHLQPPRMQPESEEEGGSESGDDMSGSDAAGSSDGEGFQVRCLCRRCCCCSPPGDTRVRVCARAGSALVQSADGSGGGQAGVRVLARSQIPLPPPLPTCLPPQAADEGDEGLPLGELVRLRQDGSTTAAAMRARALAERHSRRAFKREGKHRPVEMSSKRPVPVLREALQGGKRCVCVSAWVHVVGDIGC